MKSGRVIRGGDHDAKVEAKQALETAQAQAARLLAENDARVKQLAAEAEQLAEQLAHEQRVEAAKASAQQQHAAVTRRPTTQNHPAVGPAAPAARPSSPSMPAHGALPGQRTSSPSLPAYGALPATPRATSGLAVPLPAATLPSRPSSSGIPIAMPATRSASTPTRSPPLAAISVPQSLPAIAPPPPAVRAPIQVPAPDLHESRDADPGPGSPIDLGLDEDVNAQWNLAHEVLGKLEAAGHDLDDGAPAAASHLTGAGSVEEVTGLVIRATVPGVALGELVHIDCRGREPLPAEVVGFRGEQAVLLPLGDLAGVAPAAPVWRTGAPLAIQCGDDLLGRALDGIGHPIDGGPPLTGELWAVDRPAPPALERPPITRPLPTGVRVVDTLLTLGRGQRVGLFAAAGVGKSTLLGQLARGAAADVIVMCQVGERGRELAELLGDELAPARARTIVVCATSDAPPLVRLRAVHVATAIAEWFRERRHANVLFLCDSLTRVARAQREVGLSAGEPPARHGYPPSVFALLPRLIERTGATKHGSITAIYTVLVAGNDHDEPIADEVRGLVDGHLVLDRRLAQRGHFPPIDVIASASRLMHRVVDAAHLEAAATVRARLAIHEENRDLVLLGAYQTGRDRAVDTAIAAYPAIERVLRQKRDEAAAWDASVQALRALATSR